MKTRILSCLLAVTVLLGAAPAARAVSGYTDVPAANWAAADIRRATETGLFQGTSDTTFGLGQPISRAQFVTALVRLFGWESESPAQPTFTDCAPGRWFYTAVETAAAHDVLPPYATSFRPTAPITREEMATMLIRALGYTALAGRLAEAELPFDDVTTNRGYIAAAYDLGLMNGYTGGHFRPQTTAPREQAAAVLVRLHDRLRAESTQADAGDGLTPLRVPYPKPTAETSLPTTPLEPLSDLYDALKARKDAGADMSQIAVVLTTGGVATTTRGSKIVSTRAITAAEVENYRDRPGAKSFYSDRHQCAYLVTSGGTLTVWYQTEEAIQAKLQLCRLFGVNSYILQEK